eukprot:CAMPEP_0117443490 /NCGR_PEP_ID=MMETSP0759-20121206/4721_1 /TAXON_ID=63605 /ORGANISM="Percolomonas cosmopolitus, Strain WS" /LENGTH=179 /DNA_ID=CAMNT_0005235465 /DNA_START=272 /DNA_END=811 /DNA_ORIENTATION=-
MRFFSTEQQKPSEKIQKLGDNILSLSMMESIQLCKYIESQLQLPEDTPDPIQALLKSGLNPLVSMGSSGGFNMAQMMQMQMPAGGMAAAGAGAAEAAAPAPEEPKVEKTEFNVKLDKFDDKQKIKIIKELRKIDKSLSIKAAKDAVEGAPTVIKKDVPKEEAEEIKKALEEVGATIVLE